MILTTLLIARFPAHNGDLPFYIAAVFSGQGMSDSAALSAAATEIGATLSPAEAAGHLENLAAAPPKFLDFYRIKAGYTISIAFLHRLGIGYVTATVIPSLIAFLLMGWGLFLFASRSFQPDVALGLTLLLIAGTGMIQVGRISTPDPPSQCLLFWAIYRVRFGRPLIATLCCLILSLFFRIDNLPAVAGLLLVMRFVPTGSADSRLSTSELITALIFALACCLLVNVLSEPVFWWFRPVPYPGVVDRPAPDPGRQFILSLLRSPFPVLLALTGVFSLIRPAKPVVWALLLFILLVLPVRYLLFPHYEDRFFTGFYVAGLLLLLGELGGKREENPVVPR